MKTLILTAAMMVGVSFSSKAQHFYASFGVEHTWGVPVYVSDVIYNDYCGYEWVHAARVVHHGRAFYDVVLQRGNVFLELRIGRHGFIRRTRHWDHYPFASHVCSNVCGFHGGFYRDSYHVYHGPRRPHHRRVNKTVVINNHYHGGKHYRNHAPRTERRVVHVDRRVEHRHVSRDRYPERRGTYYSTGKTRGRENHARNSSYNEGRRGHHQEGRRSTSGRGRGRR